MASEAHKPTNTTEKPDHEKTARIGVRVSTRQRELIQQAALVTGTSVSEFILVPAVERAASVLASEQVTRLNAETADRFVAWMNEPARVLSGMKRLADADSFES